MIPILHLPGEMTPGQFGPISRVGRPLKKRTGPHHVRGGNAFRDAHHQRNAGFGGLHDRVARERRRNEDHGRIRARLLHRIGHGIENRQPEMRLTAFARSDAAHDLGAVVDGGLRVEAGFAAREALEDHARVLIHQHAHAATPAPTARTTFSAASFIPSATVKLNPGCLQNLLPLFDVGAFHANHDRHLARSARARRSRRRWPARRIAGCRRKY